MRHGELTGFPRPLAGFQGTLRRGGEGKEGGKGMGASPTSSFYNLPIDNTVKPVLFACPLFRELRDLGVFAKITGREYVYFIGNLLVYPVKTRKLTAPK